VEVLSDVLAALDALLALGAADLRGAYAESLGTLGRRVRVEMTDGTVLEGDAVDLDAEGRLVVAPDAGVAGAAGTRRTIDAGDVVHLRGVADA
jgi:BirA family biotin operon repressor/biotin-[acetyl-CoA-carboxylase] ligase